MNIFEKQERKIPEYYHFMYLDGYSPIEVMQAMNKKIRNRYIKSKEKDSEIDILKIISEVKVK